MHRTGTTASDLFEVLALTVTRPQRVSGKVIGQITYTFTTEAQRDGFIAGTWPCVRG